MAATTPLTVSTLSSHIGLGASRRESPRTAFPDQSHEIIAIRHSADAVIVEFWLVGTHRGYLGKIPPTGSRFRVRMTAYFVFDESETLVCERIYFDTLTMLKQLLGGLNMKRPANWPPAAHRGRVSNRVAPRGRGSRRR